MPTSDSFIISILRAVLGSAAAVRSASTALCTIWLYTICAISAPAGAGLVVVNYVGPDGGLWNTAANWSPATVPNDALGDTFEAIIDPSGAATVLMNGGITLTGLSITAGNAVQVPNAVTFSYSGGTLFNSGTLTLASTGSNTTFQLLAPVVQLSPIDDDGVLRLGGGLSRIIGSGAVRRLVNEPGHRIRGGGAIGANVNLNLTNDGAIEADTAGQTLTIDLVGTTTENFNANRIATIDGGSGGGALTITGTQLDNSGGDIVSEAGTLSIFGGSTVIGGMVRSDGGDLLVGAGSIFESITTSGVLRMPNANAITLRTGVVNNGTIQLESTGSNTTLQLGTDVVLSGSGGISMSAASLNRILGVGGTRRLEVGADQAIRGSGAVGQNTNLVLTNQGTITADQAVALTIDLVGTATDNFNAGVVHSVEGGELRIIGTELDNTMGTIRSGTDSLVTIGTSTIERGIIESLGGSLGVDLEASTVLVDVALAATARVPNGNQIFVAGSLENIGTLTLNTIGSNTTLFLDTDVTVSAAGDLIGTGSLARILGNGGIRRLTIDQEQSIRGSMSLGQNTNLVLTNDGTIVADLPGSTLTIDTVGAATDSLNNGTIRSDTGSVLAINAPGIDNTAGIIVADGGTVRLFGAEVMGGLIATNGAGEVIIQNSATLNGVTLDGTLRVPNATDLSCVGTIVNEGVISVESIGSNTDLELLSDVVIDGAGEIVFSNSTVNRVFGVGAPRRLTLGADQTLRGAGNLGSNTNFSLTNFGAIVADGTVPLTIDVSGDYQNLGLLEALVSNITIVAGDFTNLGTVVVNSGRTLTRSGVYSQVGGATTVAGSLTSTSTTLNGGLLTGGGSVSGALTNSFGVVAPGAPIGPLTLTGAYTQGAGGTLSVAVSGPLPAEIDRLAASGIATLAGTLEVNRAGDFIPTPTDEFTILSAASVVGEFDLISSCEPVDVIYTATEVRVRFLRATGIPGDLNGDGVVNGADLGIMLGTFGVCFELCCPADLNGDGVVNGADLGILLGAWS